MVQIIKISTLIGWLAIIANCIVPFGGQIETILNWSGIGLLAAHALETLVYIPTMKKAGGSIANHVVQCLLFGYGHFMAMQESIKAQEAA